MLFRSFNGIKMQALLWKNTLVERGHKVVLVSPWEEYDWNSFDAVHVFSGDTFDFIENIHSKGYEKIVYSPIIDTTQSTLKYRFASHWGSQKLRLYSWNYRLRLNKDKIAHYCVRSQYESNYIEKSYGVEEARISIVPLSYRLSDMEIDYTQKEPFCLHVSIISQPRKNVRRLIEAAIKYNFRLVLAGSKGSDTEFDPLSKSINSHDNITYLGRISDEELCDLYRRAKVFALPSISEGVGMVALDAAMFGCEIVITNIGGPKEYYNQFAYQVNPYSVDEIGKAVLEALEGSNQPQLQHHIFENFRFDVCIDKLIEMYSNLC